LLDLWVFHKSPYDPPSPLIILLHALAPPTYSIYPDKPKQGMWLMLEIVRYLKVMHYTFVKLASAQTAQIWHSGVS
jgi:hypothetical protein